MGALGAGLFGGGDPGSNGGSGGGDQSPGILGTGQYRTTDIDVTDPIIAKKMGKDAFYNNQNLQSIQQQAQNIASNTQNRFGPVAAQTTLSPLNQANVANYNAKLGQASMGQGTMANAATVNANNLAQVNAGNLGNAAQMQAAQIGSQDEQFRAAQLGLVGTLQNQAAGNGPSLAAIQLGQANAAAAASRMGQAASQRGFGNTAANMRELAYQQGAANQNTAMQAAQTKIQEQQSAQQQLNNVLGTSRGQDIGKTTSQAGFEQGANQANQAATNQFRLQQAANELAASQANAGAGNQAAFANAGYQQQALQGNQQAANAFGMSNQQAANQMALANLGYNNQAGQFNAQAQNAGNLANMNAANQYQALQGQMNQQTTLANQEAQLKTMGLNDAQVQAMLGMSANTQQQIQANQQNYSKMLVGQNEALNQINSGAYNNAAQNRGGLVGGAMGAIGGLFAMSDEDEKKGISEVGKSDIDKFINIDYGKNADPTKNYSNMSLSQYDDAMTAPPEQKNILQGIFQGAAAGAGGSAFGKGLASGFMSTFKPGAAAAAPTAAPEMSYAGQNMDGQFAAPIAGTSAKPNMFTQGLQMSDENEKKNIKKNPKEVKQFIDSLGAHKYQYKHPEEMGADEGTFFSPMAQEFEKSQMGKSMVTENDEGKKMVDYARGYGNLFAVAANLNDRLNKLENNGKKPKRA